MHELDRDVIILKELVVLKVESGILKHGGYRVNQCDIQSRHSGPEHLDAVQRGLA